MDAEVFEAAVRDHAVALYGAGDAERLVRGLQALADQAWMSTTPRGLDHADVWLIAYADHVRDAGDPPAERTPLQVMAALLEEELADVVSGVHLLPFYPWTSDDGFAVIDHLAVDPGVGSWADLSAIGATHRLMVDGVVNHVSASHPWVAAWLADGRDGWILEPDAEMDTSAVVRPRTAPLLTAFEDAAGRTRQAWTTFGPDQVDLDYGNPDLLLAMTEILLTYVRHGASVIRLDAVGFLWKASGTTCIHLPQTHEIVRLWRTVMDHLAPGTMLITETNVPHDENVSYFGVGSDEAHLVYQFPLAPLVLAAYVWGNAQDLSRWAAALADPPVGCTYFNFLASHDGIGLRPAEGLLSATQIRGLCNLARSTSGGVSYRTDVDGSEDPYELNTTYVDALLAVADDGLGVARVIGAHAILLALQGVPGIWLGSLFGQSGDPSLVEQTGRLRSINRARLSLESLRAALEDSRTVEQGVFEGISRLVRLRRAHPALAPDSPQHILPTPGWLVGIVRGRAGHRVFVIVSVSNRDRSVIPSDLVGRSTWRDALAAQDGRDIEAGDVVVLPPYGVMWLEEIGS
ncbi:alpha-amylase family glycosyl hydrolase [Euzebya tangerina]|uniref:alpha-amylase family glycosyl hydrolase n=1 Tax=Euzebya tangerina TaxID=591198 RepID=UPI0013C2A306|nr:alpha-amylase family glycosyl hydrolase [Euzebya tangerina]